MPRKSLTLTQLLLLGKRSLGVPAWDNQDLTRSVQWRIVHKASQDLLYAPVMFDSNELLEVVKRAWLPLVKKSDPDKLDRYRYDSIMWWTVPAHDNKTYKEVKKIHNESGPWGPKRILFWLPKRRKLSGFNFKKVFPKTYPMLRSGKYRWFQYKKGTLCVIVGPGKGHDKRHFESSQALKAWKYNFESSMNCCVW